MGSKNNKVIPEIRRMILAVVTGVLILLLDSCIIKYSFSGASIPAGVKTVSIQYFQNRAAVRRKMLISIKF